MTEESQTSNENAPDENNALPDLSAETTQVAKAEANALQDWKAALPEDLRNDPLLDRFKDAAALFKSYKSANALIGADKLAIPKAGDEEGWNAFYDRIGRPENPDGYEVAVAEGQIRDEAFEGHMRSLFHKAGLNQAQVAILAGGYQDFAGTLTETARRDMAERIAQEDAALEAEWGQAYDGNMEHARRAALKFGGEETINKLEDAVGRAAVFKMLSKIGLAMGEDNLNGEGDSNFSLSPAQARAEYDQKKTDKDWLAALQDPIHPNHKTANAERRRYFAAMDS